MSDAILYVSFGGPEGPADVMPFLENVTRGRGIPPERLAEVAEHYLHFGGKSPINDQNRAVIAALTELLSTEGPALPIYWGNRNWHPLLTDTLAQMKADGVTRAFAFVTSAFSSYSGCRQYRENLYAAKTAAGFEELELAKLRVYYNHPGFVEPMADNVRAALAELPDARLVFTAHSIPMSMADTCDYTVQLREACRLVAEACGHAEFDLVWQSRSGPPTQPWLEPDILDHLRAIAPRNAVLAPIGFVSDHMEVLYDLDTEAVDVAHELGIQIRRARTVGADPRFIAMIRELVLERQGELPARALGVRGPNHDVCPENCCPAPVRPARPASSTAPPLVAPSR
ncbi:MAG: ferrochelatase [Acidobacteria bacterium]|nr:ferrochelatase [Acidobacteriota bacterium]